MPNNKSKFRKYVTELSNLNQCNFCYETFSKNISRTKVHFVKRCKELPLYLSAILRGQPNEGKYMQ